MANNTTQNWTNITWVQLTPAAPTVIPGGSVALSAVALCTNATATNYTCPAAAVTYAWSQSTAFPGVVNATTGNNVTFLADWSPGVTTVTVAATLNDSNVSGSVSTGTNSSVVTVFKSGEPTVSIQYTTTFSLYEFVPFWVNWTVTVGNGSVAPTTTWVNFNVRDIVGNCGTQYSFLGAPFCPTVVNLTEQVGSGQTAFSQKLNYTVLNSTGYAAVTGGQFPSDNFQFIVWAVDNNSVANVSSGLEVNAYPIFTTPTGSFLSPLPGGSLSTGNVTFVVRYDGQFVQGAELTVTNSLKQVVYLQAVFATSLGNRTVGSPTPWLVVTAGVYNAVVNVTTPYGIYSFNESYTVVPAGQTIYVNQSSTQDNGKIDGISPAVFATVLLVVGLIIGLIVALVLGRMMWGTPSQPASPQPWSPSSSDSSSTTSSTGSSSGSGSSDNMSGDSSKKP
ncbi:MAG TPA: hypothetical protein VGP88_02770 [Thermoplasmata archaeon]|jgi:hypothetical protein|nr:hypothetical protein [Thermoplasmata archaeon]